MMKIKSLFFALIFSLSALTQTTALNVQAAPPARPGVAMGVASDLWWLGTSVFRGAYNVASIGHELWNNYMTKEGVYITAGVVSAVALYNYYAVISAIRGKYNPNRSPKLCVWGYSSWENHVRMRANRLDVLGRLDSERPECTMIRQAPDAQRAAAVKQTITDELAELKRDMKSLEDQFLIFFKVLEYLPGCKALGIERNYKQIKPQVGEEIEWSLQQFVTVDNAMRLSSSMSWWHPLCLTLNYGNAAYVWWELKKLTLRLELLDSWITPIAEGKARFPDYNNANVGVSHNQATFKHAVGPI